MKKIIIFLILMGSLFSETIITIDDGPNGYMKKMANYLYERNIYAIFFVVGFLYTNSQTQFKTTQKVVDMGFGIGNHSWSHDYKILNSKGYSAAYKDIFKCQMLIYTNMNIWMRYYRPPGGLCNNDTLQALHHLNLTPLGWNITKDMESFNTNQFMKDIRYAKHFKINYVLLHANKYDWECFDTVIKILEDNLDLKRLREF